MGNYTIVKLLILTCKSGAKKNKKGGVFKGARTPPTQFLLTVKHDYYYWIHTGASLLQHKEPLTNFRANLEKISGPGYKTL